MTVHFYYGSRSFLLLQRSRAGLYILGGSRTGKTELIDEVQIFTTSDDFAVLFTQARKFGIATTIAHQERYGQLGHNRPLYAATSGAGNKVVFRLTVNDAAELSPDFAAAPPTEIRQEPEFGISPEPFSHLVRYGHPNPAVRKLSVR